MNQAIACCGLDCAACEARIATVNDDNALREDVARRWSEMNGVPIAPDSINCLGCRTDGVKFSYCDMCEIRSCAAGKSFSTCGECSALDTCPTIAPMFEHNPAARTNLTSPIA